MKTLFDPPSHHNAPSTSADAAEQIKPGAHALRAQVYGFIRDRGPLGATDEEIQDSLGMPANTQRPRRWELVKSGVVRASEQRRDTRSGCRACVWVVTE